MNDLEARLRELTLTIGHLVRVLTEETQMLRDSPGRDISDLQRRKLPLVDAYERLAAGVKAEAETLSELDPELRDEFRAAIEQLKDAMEENDTALQAATKANDRLMNAVIGAIQEYQLQGSGYGSLGGMPTRSKAAAVSVRINERL